MKTKFFLLALPFALLLSACDEVYYRDRPGVYRGSSVDFHYTSGHPYSREYGRLYVRDGRHYYRTGGRYIIYDRPTTVIRRDSRHDYRGRDRDRDRDRRDYRDRDRDRRDYRDRDDRDRDWDRRSSTTIRPQQTVVYDDRSRTSVSPQVAVVRDDRRGRTVSSRQTVVRDDTRGRRGDDRRRGRDRLDTDDEETPRRGGFGFLRR